MINWLVTYRIFDEERMMLRCCTTIIAESITKAKTLFTQEYEINKRNILKLEIL